jgi:hypothetical protein
MVFDVFFVGSFFEFLIYLTYSKLQQFSSIHSHGFLLPAVDPPHRLVFLSFVSILKQLRDYVQMGRAAPVSRRPRMDWVSEPGPVAFHTNVSGLSGCFCFCFCFFLTASAN